MKKSYKQALIMAAGKGERCLPLTLTTPKPLIPINNQNDTCLALIIDQLQSLNFDRIIVNAYYLRDQIIDFIEERYTNVLVSCEIEPLETGGGLLNALPLIDLNEPLFVMNSDSYIDHLEKHVNHMYEYFHSLSNSKDVFLLAVSRIKEECQQGIGYVNCGDYFLDTDFGILTHRSKIKEEAPYVFIGPRIIGQSLLKKDYLKQFEVRGKSFSQLQIMHDVESKLNLIGFNIDAPWLSFSNIHDVENLRNYLNSTRS